MQILCHCTRQSSGNSRLVGPCHGRVGSRESGEAEWLGQGEPGKSKTLPRTSAQSPRQLGRASLVSLFLFLFLSPLPPLFSFSVAHLLNCLLARSSSFVVPFLSLSLSPSLYIPHLLFPLYPRYLLSSLTFAPFHRRHPLRIVSSLPRSLSLHLSLSPYSRSPAPSAFSVRRRLFGPFPSYSLLSSPMVSFTFFHAASGATPLTRRQRSATTRTTTTPRVSGFPSPFTT